MKTAIVGAGISGLGAALILSQKYEVEVFEADQRLGGHARTVTVTEDGRALPMDVGFLVYNELTYPNLCGLFDYLGVETAASDMTLSIRARNGALEWSGTDMNSVFGQRRNLFNPGFYAMLISILRFHREAEANLALAQRHGWTLGDLLRERGFGRRLREDYVLPMGAAIWSTPEAKMLDYPAATFLQFFLNHKLLQVNQRPVWRTVAGGSMNYVEKIAAKLPSVHLGVPVASLRRDQGGVWVKTARGETLFDRVILATHAPTARRLLGDACAPEVAAVLASFKTQDNAGLLHRDASSMPRARRCWSSWNVFSGAGAKASLTYHLNRLQKIATDRPYFLTLNPFESYAEPVDSFAYAHPLFDAAAIAAQKKLPSVQGIDGIYFAGAWTGYGFHEDGLKSAVAVARLLGCEPPWKVT